MMKMNSARPLLWATAFVLPVFLVLLNFVGVLSAINAVLRGFGAGTAGIEMVFFLLVLGGLAVRLDLTYEDLQDLELAVDTLLDRCGALDDAIGFRHCAVSSCRNFTPVRTARAGAG